MSLVKGLRRFFYRASRRSQQTHSAERQRVWEAKWADSATPRWRSLELPPEVRDAIASRWFRAGSRLIDIGCGSGELAAWIAAQGFDTVGVDYAASAIERARSHMEPSQANLRFELVDMCGPAPDLGTFESLFDRGCFHGLHPTDHPDYARNVAALSRTGSRFMMMCRLRELSREGRVRQVADALEEHFAVERVTDATMGVPGARRDESDGVVVWLKRLRPRFAPVPPYPPRREGTYRSGSGVRHVGRTGRGRSRLARLGRQLPAGIDRPDPADRPRLG